MVRVASLRRGLPPASMLLLLPLLLPAGAAEAAADAEAAAAAVAVPKIFLNTTEGTTLLQKATHNAPFYKLVPHFVTENPGMCGPSTAVMVMNALATDGLKAPISREYSMGNTTYHYWEQHNVWDAFDAACVREATTPWFGSLEQVVKGFLQCRSVAAEPILASNSSESAFRSALKEAFSGQPLSYVGVNFHRQLVGQAGYGHHSPVGAYDESTDQVLIMDVARYKYPPVWVHLADLWNSMSGDAPSGGKGWDTPRGFFVAKMPTTARASDGLVLI